MVIYSFSKGYKIKLDNLLYNENHESYLLFYILQDFPHILIYKSIRVLKYGIVEHL